MNFQDDRNQIEEVRIGLQNHGFELRYCWTSKMWEVWEFRFMVHRAQSLSAIAYWAHIDGA